jgi:hypothetical protein
MTQNITFGMLKQKLVWDHVPMQELQGEVMDSLLPAYGGKSSGTPGRLYYPQEGIQAYVIPEVGTSRVSDDTVASGILIAYVPVLDSTNDHKGLKKDQINVACESLADFMGIEYRSDAGCVVKATLARENHPAKPSPREAFFKVVDFRYMLQGAIDYVAENMTRNEHIDSLVSQYIRLNNKSSDVK